MPVRFLPSHVYDFSASKQNKIFLSRKINQRASEFDFEKKKGDKNELI